MDAFGNIVIQNDRVPTSAMAISDLLIHCQSHLPDVVRERFCLELFRRAIEQRCDAAWYGLHTQYYALVRYWIGACGIQDPDTQDDLTQEAFMAFWNYYTPAKLARATGLASVLAYLKSCAFTAVAQWQRRQKLSIIPFPDEAWDAPGSEAVEAKVERDAARQTLLARLAEHCADARERLVLQYILLEGLKSAALAECYPQEFPEVHEVYRIKRNLMGRLQRDPELRAICENG